MIRKVLTYPDPKLKRTHVKVTRFDAELKALCRDLVETMEAYSGLGLAAMQVGDTRSVFVMDFRRLEEELPMEEQRIFICINPVITPLSDLKIEDAEGCLSVPGKSARVLRYQKVKIDFLDPDEEPRTLTLEDLPAVCVQHEYDHLQGKLYIDRLEARKREALLSAYDPTFVPEAVEEALARR